MAIDSVNTVNATSNSSVNQQDFLRILLTQLNSQNPLKPMDNTAFVAQLAQFSQLEQTQQMLSGINQLVSVQTATQTVALLGKTVSLLNNNAYTTGVVSNVSFSGTTPTLSVKPAAGADINNIERKQILDVK
ncbi:MULTISPECIES: flagellar hook assembly protein FlgD [Massilia]|uniref:Basal-body rod modification protein FlgD n=2 Tax=Massilia TaxID=149698 RepID=A0ABX0M5U0_9BURK|nr:MULTISPECIES: flagellar hook capping FlgD N-terminal domain-containing protein [Massilia]NHZ42590.1 flagellar hook capping protein [Massilia aquatica]NHZ89939.1 flagellar hook capping protein [Massilia mucilaginosa]